MKLKNIKIKGFRGFNKEQSVNLDAQVVLIYGLNGSGKSSVTEALEWLFFGDISRRRLSPCRSEYQYEEYLRNLFYNGTENPYVEVEGAINDRQYVIRKELVTAKDVKYFINNTEVADFGSLPLNLESYSRPMLAQTEIAALVNTEQKDRWEQLSYILGQEDLTKLREHLIELRNAKKDVKYKETEKEFDGLLVDLRKNEETSVVSNSLERLDTKEIVNFIATLIAPEEIEVINRNYGDAIKTKLNRLIGSDIARRVIELKVGDISTLETYFGEVKRSFVELEMHCVELTKEKVDLEIVEFLKKGKTLAKPPECPFCLQRTLTEDRINEIDKDISLADKASEKKMQCEALIKLIGDKISTYQVTEALKQMLPSTHELKIVAQKLSDLKLDVELTTVQKYEKEIEEFLDVNGAHLSTHLMTHTKVLESFYFHNDESITPKQSEEALTENFDGVTTKLRILLSKWDSIRDEVIKPFGPGSGSVQEEIERWLLIGKLHSFIDRENAFLRRRKALAQLDEIQRKLESFEKKEVENLLAIHSEEIKDYYNKINPNEKMLFRRIEVKKGIRRQARLIADAYGKEINPVTIFSEAHTNCLSLSIYFPQRVDRNPTWQVLVLDDPVQSMDICHASSLIGILAEKKLKKQIIVLTHAKSFAEDFINRFDRHEVLHYEFYECDENGPKIKIKHGKTLDYLAFVAKNRNGDQVERQTAGGALRNAICSVCGEILLKKGRTLVQIRNFDESGLSKLFDQLERSQIDTDDINKLKALVTQAHADSHAWNIRDTTPQGLLHGETIVREILSKYVGN
jgi:DNA repair exonuclease SbcCD ATPase subunit